MEELLRRPASGGLQRPDRPGRARPLRPVDEVAYLRFASVYKHFDAAADFHREIELLTKQAAVDAVEPCSGAVRTAVGRQRP